MMNQYSKEVYHAMVMDGIGWNFGRVYCRNNICGCVQGDSPEKKGNVC